MGSTPAIPVLIFKNTVLNLKQNKFVQNYENDFIFKSSQRCEFNEIYLLFFENLNKYLIFFYFYFNKSDLIFTSKYPFLVSSSIWSCVDFLFQIGSTNSFLFFNNINFGKFFYLNNRNKLNHFINSFYSKSCLLDQTSTWFNKLRIGINKSPFFYTSKNKKFINTNVGKIINKFFKSKTYIIFLVNNFFKNSTTRLFKSKKNHNLFLIKPFDQITLNFIRLTRSSKNVPIFNFFVTPNKLLAGFYGYNQKLNILKNYAVNNYFFESNFFFINKTSFKQVFFNYNKQPSDKLILPKFYVFAKNKSKFININNKAFNKLLKFINPSLINRFDFVFFLLTSPFFFKYFFSQINASAWSNFSYNYIISSMNPLANSTFFYNTHFENKQTNLFANASFNYILKKKIIQIFNYNRFPNSTLPWHYQNLIKFLEYSSGKKVSIFLNSFINNSLTAFEYARCFLWSQKVKYFRKVLGPRLFLNESVQIIYLSLKNKDPFTLSNWMVTTMGKISFWKFKTFLRYIKYLLRYFIWGIFKDISVKGIKFQLKGKISVAGNARTRTAFHYVGFTSHGTFDNKILYHLNLVKTFTGVLGLKLWIVF